MCSSVAIRLHPEDSSDSGARAIAVACRIAVKCIFEVCSGVVNKESRTERNKREVRGRILAAAAELFDANGVETFRGLPEDEIATMIGGSAAAFYGIDTEKIAPLVERIGPEGSLFSA